MPEKPVILTRNEEGPRAIHDNIIAGESLVVNGSGSFSSLHSVRMTGFSWILTVGILSGRRGQEMTDILGSGHG